MNTSDMSYDDSFPAGLPADVWYEITARLFAPDLHACRALYRLRQVCKTIRNISISCISDITREQTILTTLNEDEIVSAEMCVGVIHDNLSGPKMVFSGLVSHFEWIDDGRMIVTLWRAIGGVIASDIISSMVNISSGQSITTIMKLHNIGSTYAVSVAFTANNEGGFSLITVNTTEAVSTDHLLNPIKKYVPVADHSILIREYVDLIDPRSMSEKLMHLHMNLLTPADIGAINAICISPDQLMRFDRLKVNSSDEFKSFLSVIEDISADNSVLPAHAYIALLRDNVYLIK